MEKTYFTVDGTYGCANEGAEILILETDGWTPEMWEAIEGTSDNGRMFLASHFASGWHPMEVEDGTPKCRQCFLEPNQLVTEAGDE